VLAARLRPDGLGMKRSSQISVAGIVAGLVLATAGVAGAAGSSSSTRLNTLDKSLLVQINAVRQAHALRPLKLSAALSAAADQHTTEMGNAGYFAHASLDHTLFWQRIQRSYPARGHHSWSVGENLLWLAPDVSAADAISLWLNSPEHRANLLDPAWREIGIAARHSNTAPGTYSGQPVTIITTDFGVRQ
jgi:uncharacterized protein YkwD